MILTVNATDNMETLQVADLAVLESLFRRGCRAEVVRVGESLQPTSPWFVDARILAVRSHMENGAFHLSIESAVSGASMLPDSAARDALLTMAAYAKVLVCCSIENRRIYREESNSLRAHGGPKWKALAERWDARLTALEIALQERSISSKDQVVEGLKLASSLYREAGMPVEAREEMAKTADMLVSIHPKDPSGARKIRDSLRDESWREHDLPMEFRMLPGIAEMDLADALDLEDLQGFSEASILYEKCRSLAAQAELFTGEAECDASLGRVLMRFCDERGPVYLLKALKAWQRHGLRSSADAAWIELESWHAKRGDTEKLEELERLRSPRDAVTSDFTEWLGLSKLAHEAYVRGDPSAAMNALQLTQEVAPAIGQRAATLMLRISSLLQRGDRKAAEGNAKEAVNLLAAVAPCISLADAYFHLGMALDDSAARTISCWEQSVASSLDCGEYVAAANYLVRIARLHAQPPLDHAKESAASICLERAGALLGTRRDQDAVAARINLTQAHGQLAFFLNRLDDCARWYDQTQMLCQTSGDCASLAFQLTQQALVLFQIARSSGGPERWDQAAMRLLWARECFGKMNLRPREFDMYRLHAMLMLERSKGASSSERESFCCLAEASLEAGATILDEFVAGRAAEDLRERQAGHNNLATQRKEFLNVGLEHFLGRDGSCEMALLWLERMKARSLLDAMSRANQSLTFPSDGHPGLRLRMFEVEDGLFKLGSGDALSRKRAFHLNRELEKILDDLSELPETAGYLSLRRARPVSWPEWQKQLRMQSSLKKACGRSVVSLHFIWPASPTGVIRVIACRPEWETPRWAATSVSREQVETYLSASSQVGVRGYLSQAVGRGRFEELSGLLEPLSEWIRPEWDIVALIPHGQLHSLPLHALGVGGYPLISQTAVFYAPSAAVLRMIWERRANRKEPSVEVADFAFFACPSDAGSPGYLHGAEKEAQAIAGILKSRAYLGGEVTRGLFLKAARTARIIHFAGHGLQSADGWNSGLSLGGTQCLAASDFYNSRLQADLVTLSGCATGKSIWTEGDEAVGLVPSLFHAGASSVLASQWDVNDGVTLRFMQDFYRATSADPSQSKADAVRDAMEGLRSMQFNALTNTVGIADWAPFFLTGDWA